MSSNRSIAAAAALALLVGACASPGPKTPTADLLRPTEQYKVKVEQTPEQLALAPHADGLSAAQSTALRQFAELWRGAGEGEVLIRTPATGDQSAVSHAAAATQAELETLGVPRNSMRLEAYDAAADPRAPLLVSFQRYTAKGPDCSQGWDNLTSTGQNTPSTHFGCAVTANFAAQIADPRDILQPAQTDAPDAGRRSTVLGLYRKGEVTSTKQDDQATGTVSKAVQ